jgi:hypothetical protein
MTWCAALSSVGAAARAPLVPPQAAVEISGLLAAIGVSGCDFYRNGSWHDAQVAQAHLTDKYRWLAGHDRIRTAEDFIELAATRSTLSGAAYAVRCPGAAPVSSNSWLTELLQRLRDAAAGASREWRDAPANHLR